MDVPSTCSCDPADCGVGGMTAAPVRYQGRSYIVFTRSATSSSTTATSSHVDSLPNGSSGSSSARQGSPCSQPDGCNLCHLLDIRSQARTVYDSGTEEDSEGEDDNAKLNSAFMRTRSRVRPHCVVGSSFKRKCKTQIGSASKTFVIP